MWLSAFNTAASSPSSSSLSVCHNLPSFIGLLIFILPFTHTNTFFPLCCFSSILLFHVSFFFFIYFSLSSVSLSLLFFFLVISVSFICLSFFLSSHSPLFPSLFFIFCQLSQCCFSPSLLLILSSNEETAEGKKWWKNDGEGWKHHIDSSSFRSDSSDWRRKTADVGLNEDEFSFHSTWIQIKTFLVSIQTTRSFYSQRREHLREDEQRDDRKLNPHHHLLFMCPSTPAADFNHVSSNLKSFWS